MLQLILRKAIELGASDIHLKTGSVPVVRVKKRLIRLENFKPIEESQMEAFIEELLGNNKKKLAEFEEFGEADTSYSLPGLARLREVGIDTSSFARGLRAALREDPDVIFVGEIRDTETAQIALQAAETGHLVLSTLHTLDAKETVNRIIGMFNLEVREQIRIQLAETLVAVFSQRLLPRKDKAGVIPAVEVLINTPSIKECIIDPEKLNEIPNLMEKGKTVYGTQTFDQHLEELYRKGLIDYNTAIAYASKPADLELRLKGVSSGGRGFF
ncbi:ATPase, T2SS/T4P/T4SS family [Thermocrinis sp.]|uniref:type IV pilus twitching motility protein PilT n=1 Tax=Thermocrinis sp. TaxID=2024383 RepID=UPI002FDCCC34